MGIVDFIKPKQQEVSVAEFYAQHRDEIIRLIAEEAQLKIKDLKYEFTSVSGKKYFSIINDKDVPFMRWAKGVELKDWWANGLAAHEFDKIRAEQKVCLAHIKAKTDEAPAMIDKLAYLDGVLDTRRASALPYFVAVNLVANYLIREDEDPMIISQQVLSEKCDDIEAEIQAGRCGFFLTLPQLRVLSEGQSISLEELTQSLQVSRIEAEKNVTSLKTFLSWHAAEQGRKTSKTR